MILITNININRDNDNINYGEYDFNKPFRHCRLKKKKK